MDDVVLVKGWKKGANWSFPRGKINKDEKDLDCAIREVYEETGYDIKGAGLAEDDENTKFIEVTMREQHMRLYVFRGVPMDTRFEPRTRKEISKIQWYNLSELPTLKKQKHQQEGRGEDLAVNANKFYMVAPFLVPLKKWIIQQKKQNVAKGSSGQAVTSTPSIEAPRLAQTNPPTSNTEALSSVDDMKRLMANLRQSGQTASMSDLPEVSEPEASTQDAAAQLKNILCVTPAASTQASIKLNSTTPHDAKSNALLALLRNGSSTTEEQDILLKQSNESPATVRSRDSHTPYSRQSSTIPRQPTIQLPPKPLRTELSPSRTLPSHPLPSRPLPINPLPSNLPTSDSKSSNPPSSSLLPLDPPSSFSRPQHPLPLNPLRSNPLQTLSHSLKAPRPGNHLQNLNIAHSEPPSSLFYAQVQRKPYHTHPPQLPPTSTTQNLRRIPAPYQRTGDPQFAQSPQFPNKDTPSIPPASKLPAPKLTTHSSALLNLFKTSQTTIVPGSNKPVEPLSPPHPDKSAALDRQSVYVEEQLIAPLSETLEPQASTKRATSKEEIGASFKLPQELGSPPEERDADSKIPQNLHQPLRQSRAARKGVKIDSETDLEKKTAMRPESGSIRTPSSKPVQPNVTRSKHQDTLLNLFRKPSFSAAKDTDISESTLEPSLGPAELSAQPSPGHSKDASQINETAKKKSIRDHTTSQDKIQDRRDSNHMRDKLPASATVAGFPNDPHQKLLRLVPRPSRAPVSATVTGPLNTPQFDAVSRKSLEANSITATASKNGIVVPEKSSPVRILSRPLSSQPLSSPVQRIPHVPMDAALSESIAAPSPAANFPTTPQRHFKQSQPRNAEPTPFDPITTPAVAVKHPISSSNKSQPFEARTSHTSKPFHPQILRRPIQPPSVSQEATFPSPVHPTPSPKDRLPFDRHTSQPQEHKQTLLTLFSKPSLKTSPVFSTPAPIVSPLTDISTSNIDPTAFAPTASSRSRIGSLASLVGQGLGGMDSALQTPRSVTTPVDRSFLLGYLEGVAKAEGM
ncbi:mRNA-decapping enzyme subunit 2 [Toensbergia leucococca]|nr:mRNA-decapping enzyme subunit 2 [Toensbergia leucococca]